MIITPHPFFKNTPPWLFWAENSTWNLLWPCRWILEQNRAAHPCSHTYKDPNLGFEDEVWCLSLRMRMLWLTWSRVRMSRVCQQRGGGCSCSEEGGSSISPHSWGCHQVLPSLQWQQHLLGSLLWLSACCQLSPLSMEISLEMEFLSPLRFVRVWWSVYLVSPPIFGAFLCQAPPLALSKSRSFPLVTTFYSSAASQGKAPLLILLRCWCCVLW